MLNPNIENILCEILSSVLVRKSILVSDVTYSFLSISHKHYECTEIDNMISLKKKYKYYYEIIQFGNIKVLM